MSIYSDFKFNIDNKEPKLTDDYSIKQSIKNILFTDKGERQFEPEFGSHINQLLFEKMNPITELTLKNEIIFALQNYEPRISVVNIDVVPNYDNQVYNVKISYLINKLNISSNINLSLNIQGI